MSVKLRAIDMAYKIKGRYAQLEGSIKFNDPFPWINGN